MAFAAAGSAATYYAKDKPPSDLTECYGGGNDPALVAEVFLPEPARRNGAAVLLIHGGGWYAGSRSAFLWHAHRLALRGYVAATIDYRLAPPAIFPAAVEDCQAAVQWLRRQAGRFGIREDRIGAFGSSAGAHLVACLGVMGAAADRVNCVVAVHGLYDFILHMNQHGSINRHWEDFLGGPLADQRERWVQASPALHVDRQSAPMLLTHDPGDTTVPYVQSVSMAKALMDAGRPVQFLPTPGSGHGFVYNPQNPWTQQVWPVALAWFDQHLLDLPGADADGKPRPLKDHSP